MEGMEDMYLGLGKNFLLASIIYLPESLLVELDDRETIDLLRPYANRPFIIAGNGSNYFVELDHRGAMSEVMKKKVLLVNNTFQLIKLRDELTEDLFGYVMDKYMEQLMGFSTIAEWMHLNAKSEMEGIGNDLLLCLEMQQQSFFEHLREVENRLLGKRMLAKMPSMESVVSERLAEVGSILGKNEPEREVTPDKTKPVIEQSRKDRLDVLKRETRDTVDSLVLKKVFGIDINDITEKQ